MAKLFLMVLLAFSIASSNAVNWCDITCTKNGNTYKHTMCLFKSPNPARTCGKVVQIGLTKPQIQQILDTHNKVRRAVGKNLPPLVWDKTLETVAQRWTNQCPDFHDKCRNLEQGRWSGQNYAWQSSSRKDKDIQSLIDDWAGEKRFASRAIIASYHETEPTAGHYTQMVWAKTTKIGCGFVVRVEDDGLYGQFLICNYNPGGNIGDQPVY